MKRAAKKRQSFISWNSPLPCLANHQLLDRLVTGHGILHLPQNKSRGHPTKKFINTPINYCWYVLNFMWIQLCAVALNISITEKKLEDS